MLLTLAMLLGPLAVAATPDDAVKASDHADAVVVVRDDAVDGPGTVTRVEASDLPLSADVADAVDRAPGAVVRRLGGPGDFAAVSLRGASLRQTTVLVDGVPLNPDGIAAVDLSELPLSAFARVDVHRGGVPPALAPGGVGGVVSLVSGTRAGPVLTAAAGSFRTARIGAVVPVRGARSRGLVAVAGLRSSGDFLWFDDAATRYTPGDDAVRRRANNDVAQATVHAVVRHDLGDVDLVVVESFGARDEGVPGPAGARTTSVRFGAVRNLVSVEARRGGERADVRVRAWGTFREERLDDALGEIGVSAERTRDRAASVGLRGVQVWTPSERLSLTAVADGRTDVYAAHDRLTATSAPVRIRHGGRASVSARVGGARAVVEPVLEATALGPVTGADQKVRLVATPRIAGRVALTEAVFLGMSGGRFLRAPDLLELYGDRGAMVGRPDLRPETGWQADVTLGATTAAGEVTVTPFLALRTDGIVYVQNAQRTAIPMNLDRTFTGGVEVASRWRVGRVELVTDLAWTHAVDRSPGNTRGNRLPRVPILAGDHATTVRVGDRLFLGHRLDHASGVWLDATNWFVSPPRTLHGAFIRVDVPAGPSLELSADNLMGVRVQPVPRNPLDPTDTTRIPQAVTDFAGYPLPGRSVMLTARWTP